MRLRLKDGRWYETETAIHVTDKLRYTARGNWVYHRLAEGVVIGEDEAVELMIAVGQQILDSAAFAKLPEHIRDQLLAHLYGEFSLGDEV